MADSTEFRPTASPVFAPGALGENTARYRATVTRRYRLSSGTPVIHARPENAEARRRLVAVPSLRGHNAMFAELCTRLAEVHGFEVISPELFPGEQHLTDAERIARCRAWDDRRVLGDMQLAAAQLQPGSVVVIGFCLGGMFACKALAVMPIAGAVSFYGFIRLPEDWRREGREEPLEALQHATVPVLGLFGGKDPLISTSDIAALQTTRARVQVFDEAGHAFAHDPLLPSYRLEDAREAWRTACEFIDQISGATHE